jgi:glutathione S-transferase
MALVLYYSPGAGSMSAHIALEEVGAEYEPRMVKLAQNEQRRPGYLAINPRGRVPALVLDDGAVLTESAAILLYLARAFPDAKLWPEDPAAQARCIEWLSWLASGVHVAFAQTRRPMRFVGQNPEYFEAVKMAGMNFLRSAFIDIERRLANSQYAAGDSLSIADLHLFVFFLWGRNAGFIAPAAAPSFTRWGETLGARPSVRRMAELEGLKIVNKPEMKAT